MNQCPREFEAMQMGWRKWYIRKVELATFKKFGLWIKDRDVLEVGCGSGYAASLITCGQDSFASNDRTDIGGLFHLSQAVKMIISKAGYK